MTSKLTLDKAGRVVLPKPLRDELQLQPGDTLVAETAGEEITLRPLRGDAPLRKKRGIWVFSSGEPLSEESVQQTLRTVRGEREKQNAGRAR
jgi:AbrB family looped-hinge helix DNA binding protein